MLQYKKLSPVTFINEGLKLFQKPNAMGRHHQKKIEDRYTLYR